MSPNFIDQFIVQIRHTNIVQTMENSDQDYCFHLNEYIDCRYIYERFLFELKRIP